MKVKTSLLGAIAALAAVVAQAEGPVVGYMLDVSRNKVPTMASLYRMVDVLAELGYNQFQLYTEHTFAYRDHAVVWNDASPMTAEEVRALDAYCAGKGIDLVPNQNSFGHLEKWLEHPKYRSLAEAPEGGVKTPWKSTIVTPRALCPTDRRSLEFVASLYDELLPNFRSKLFNVGCDEVWELESQGRGRSWEVVKEKGRQRVWLDYFREICRLAEERGRTPMFWDDMIVRRHPELIPELPANAIALEWGYEIKKGIDAAIFERDCANLRKNGRRFYVCPGTSGWNAITGRHFNMKTNVNEAVNAGLKHGAEGYLLCDWGNGGMCQPWVTALPALVYMRAKVDGREMTDGEIAQAVDRLTGAKCGKALLRFQDLYRLSGEPNPNNRNTLYTFMSDGANGRRPRGLTDAALGAVFAEYEAAKKGLDLTGAPAWVSDGFATIDLLMETLRLRWAGEHDRIAREIPPRYRELWLRHNRPGGLDESVKQNFKPAHVCEVLVCFDTEDYTCAKNADGIVELTKICIEEGVIPHHQVVGEMAKALVGWKRADVIELMKHAFIGTQTRYHTLHPDILELSDGADYAAAYRRVWEQEKECADILKDVFGVKRLWASCPPGNSESYVANRVYADLGITFDLGAGFLEPTGADVWFAGQRRIAYGLNFEWLQRQKRRYDWAKDGKRLLDEWAGQDRFCLNCHPNKVFSTEFWDGINYRRENKGKWGAWIQPKMRDLDEVREYLANVRRVMRDIKEDPRFRFVTIPEIAATQKPRVALTRKDMGAIRAEWAAKGMGPVRTPASWSVADVFCAAVAMLKGEKEFMPANAYGFLEMPVSSPRQMDVTRAEIVAAAKAMDTSSFLPARIDLDGGKTIGPRQFLYAALEFLVRPVDVYTVIPGDQLGSFAPLRKLEFRTHRNTWLHCPPPVFEDAYASDRLRWQIWTLRYE